MYMESARKNSGIILDSNIWIGYFLETDAHHAKAVQLISGLKGQSIYIPEYVLLECATIIKMHSGQTLGVQCIDFFINTENITVLSSVLFFFETLDLFKELNEKYLSFVDISLVHLSQSYDVQTFDKKLALEIQKIQKS